MFYLFHFLHRSDGGPIYKWSAGDKPGARCRTSIAIWCVEHCLYQNPLSVSITEVCLQYEVSQSVWLLHSETKYIPDEKRRRMSERCHPVYPMLISDVTFLDRLIHTSEKQEKKEKTRHKKKDKKRNHKYVQCRVWCKWHNSRKRTNFLRENYKYCIIFFYFISMLCCVFL